MKFGTFRNLIVPGLTAGVAFFPCPLLSQADQSPVNKGGESAEKTSVEAGMTAETSSLSPPSFDTAKDIMGGFRIGRGERPNMQNANFRYGNVTIDLTGYFQTTFDNNINQSNTNPIWDIISEVGLDFNTFWEISSENSFSFRTNVSYVKYWRNSQYDSANNFLNIQPETELAYYFKMGPVTAKVFDNLSYQIEPGQRYFYDTNSGQLATSVQYPRWDNIAGIRFDWEPVKDWYGSFTSSRSDTIPDSKLYENLRRTTYANQVTLDHPINSDLTAGVFGGWTQTTYKTAFNNDSQGFNYGYHLTNYFTPFLIGSWRHTFNDMTFNRGGFNGDTTDYAGQNYDIGLTHQAFREINHGIQWSRTSDLGFASNTRETDTYSYFINYFGLSEATLNAGFSYSTVGDSGGNFAEQATLRNYTLGYTRIISRKTTFSANYSHLEKDSTLSIGSHTRDQVVFRFTYDF